MRKFAERSHMTVTILMSTYNGEKYLSEQIESIRMQSHCGKIQPCSDIEKDRRNIFRSPQTTERSISMRRKAEQIENILNRYFRG